MKKSILGLALAGLVSTSASADMFYIDVGVDFGGTSNTAAGDTTTGLLESMTYVYQSNSIITDMDGSFGLSAGDTITTTGGFVDGAAIDAGIGANMITGLVQGEAFGGPSHNNFGSSWGITFQIDISGTIGASGELLYNTGSIDLFYYETTMVNTSEFVELFSIDVYGGSNNLGGTFVDGTISNFGTGDVNGVDAEDVFNVSGNGVADMSFGEYVAANIDLLFANLDLNTDNAQFSGAGFDNEGRLLIAASGDHDGSLTFAVPEPSSIAVMGLGLLGLAGFSRKRKNA